MANYDRINWQNGAAGGTRLNADNLNHMDAGIKDLETKFLSFVTAYQSDINKKANKTDPTTSGTMTHTGDATISGSLTLGETDIAGAIEELEERSKGIELEGQDVLTTSAAAKIRAIDVKGKSSQDGTLIIGSFNYTWIAYSAVQGMYYVDKVFPSDTFKPSDNTEKANIRCEGLTVITQADGLQGTRGIAIDRSGSLIVSDSSLNGKSTTEINGILNGMGVKVYTPAPTPANPIPIVDASGVIQAIGKNLIDYSDITTWRTLNNVHYRKLLKLDPNSYYTVSTDQDYISGGINYAPCFFESTDNIDYAISSAGDGVYKNSPRTIKPTADGYVLFAINKECTSYHIQLERGTTATEYTAYAANAINIEGNLFTGFEYVDKYITSAGEITDAENIAVTKAIPISGNVFSVSYTKKANKSRDLVAEYDANGAFLRRTVELAIGSENGALTKTITVGTDAKFVRLSMEKHATQIMVANGSIACTYNDSLSITLRSLGDVSDELIVYPDKTGKIIQRAGISNKAVNRYTTNTSGKYRFILATNAAEVASHVVGNVICSAARATTSNTAGTYGCNEGISIDSNGNVYIYIESVSGYTVEQFNEWAEANNLMAYYELKAPTETPLTASQVKAVLALQTYNPETFIETELDLQSVGYTGDIKQYIDEKLSYSYEDQIVGTWADGKPLHRRVEEGTLTSSGRFTPFVSSGVLVNIKSISGAYYNNGAYDNISDVARFVIVDDTTKYMVRHSIPGTPNGYTLIVEYTINDEEAAISTLSEEAGE